MKFKNSRVLNQINSNIRRKYFAEKPKNSYLIERYNKRYYLIFISDIETIPIGTKTYDRYYGFYRIYDDFTALKREIIFYMTNYIGPDIFDIDCFTDKRCIELITKRDRILKLQKLNLFE